jgi:hypothetical protein
MGYTLNETASNPNFSDVSATPNPVLTFGLSKTDASFGALLWDLLASGPP